MNEQEKSYFSKEQQEKAINWINSKWIIKTCEVCQTNQWELSDFMVASPRFEGGMIIGGQIAPHIMLMCKSCGNTKFFNAVIMGVVRGKEKNE